MSTDITTFYEPETLYCDWRVADGDLQSGSDLNTAIVISLFTDRVATRGDHIEGSDKRGWWGDAGHEYKMGSRLWLLRRQKLTTWTYKNIERLSWRVGEAIIEGDRHYDTDPYWDLRTFGNVEGEPLAILIGDSLT